MENLPKEVLIKIFNKLDGHSMFNASKACSLWSDIINDSIEISNNFTYKIYTGHCIMPDFMSYEDLRAYFFGQPLPELEDKSIKVEKYYPHMRDTEISHITDLSGSMSDEMLGIFEQYGRLWKSINIHEINLNNVGIFCEIFELFLNVTKMKFSNCTVAEDMDDEVMLGGRPLPNLKDLEVHRIDWRIFKTLKHAPKVESLKLTMHTRDTTNEFTEFLMKSAHLKTIEVFSKAKDSFDTSLKYPFSLENLNIDRSDNFDNRNEMNDCKFSECKDFILSQKSLKNLKFKGKMDEKDIARIAKDLRIKDMNLHFMGDCEERNVEKIVVNCHLERIMLIGCFVDVQIVLKYFTGIQYFEFYASSPDRLNELFINLTILLPNIKEIKFYSAIEVPFLDPTFNRLNYLEKLRIVLKEVEQIPRVLKCCPALKKLTLSSKLSGDFPDEEFSMASIEDLELTVQLNLGGETLLTNIHKTLKMFPNLSKLSINSQLEGKLYCKAVEMKNVTTLKIDFTCTDEQCNNMYEMIRNCPNLKHIEMNSRLIGELTVEGGQMKCLESLTVMGIAETVNAFQNLVNFMKISPNLKKLDFWVRGNSSENYFYPHSDEISKWTIEDFNSIDELKIWRYHGSEVGILDFLCGSCKNVKKIEWNLTNRDLYSEDLERVTDNMKKIEELNFGKEFIFDAELLEVVQRKLINLKTFKIFAEKPLTMQKVVKEIFGESEINFIFNPGCLEEWLEDEIEIVRT